MNPIFERFLNQRKHKYVVQLDLFDSHRVVDVVSDPDVDGGTRHTVMHRDETFSLVPSISSASFSLKSLRNASLSVPQVVTAHGSDVLGTLSVVNRNISNIDFVKLRDGIQASRNPKSE